MSHKPKHTQEKKLFLPIYNFAYDVVLRKYISVDISRIDYFLQDRGYKFNVLMPFPAVFVLLQNVINGFILYKSEKRPLFGLTMYVCAQ